MLMLLAFAVQTASTVAIAFDIDPNSLKSEYSIGSISYTRITSESTQRHVSELLSNEAARYPGALISKSLNSIAVLDTLAFDGLEFGGTYLPKKRQIVIATYESVGLQGDDVIRDAFHHEYSSLLITVFKKKFNVRDWSACNAPGFRYRHGGGYGAVRDGVRDRNLDPSLNAAGILCVYGTADREEDINTFAEYIFGSRSKSFWTIAKEQPRIRQKALILLKFYMGLDAGFKLPLGTPADVADDLQKAEKRQGGERTIDAALLSE